MQLISTDWTVVAWAITCLLMLSLATYAIVTYLRNR
jgi:hypothetical protein